MEASNNNKKNLPDDINLGIGNILGIVSCLKYLGNINDFLQWIHTYHHLRANPELLKGYKFIIEVLLAMLCDEISTNKSLLLTEDDFQRRASFFGIPYDQLPNSCEKSIILRNIYTKTKCLVAARNWRTLAVELERFHSEVVQPLHRLRHAANSCQRTKKEVAINYAAIFMTYIFLNDTSAGIPHGYGPIFIDGKPGNLYEVGRRRHKYLSQVFTGYKYSLQFLWYRMLGESFSNTSIVEMHRARNWNELDKFFDSTGKEVIGPIERETGTLVGFDSLVVLTKLGKIYIKSLIEKGPPEIPLSQGEELDRMFLWYHIELIDGSDLDFCAAAAFIPMLIGSVEMRSELGIEDRLKVIRLVHGSTSEHRRDYSYAILIELYGAISDASGWILFYDCCSDAGSTAHWYATAEQYIQRYLKEGLISLEERRIDKKSFLKIMRHRLISFTKEEMYEAMAARQKLRMSDNRRK